MLRSCLTIARTYFGHSVDDYAIAARCLSEKFVIVRTMTTDSNDKMSTWKRPEDPPRVWQNFDGRRKTDYGESAKFSIQEVSTELENDVIDFMTKYHITEEPICSTRDAANDPVTVRDLQSLWRIMLHQGISVVALKVHSDPGAKPVIAGTNILYVKTAEDKANVTGSMQQIQSDNLKGMCKMLDKLVDEADVLKRYDVNQSLRAVGFCVDPSLRGQGIGEELLRVRDDVGRAYKIPVSNSIFTATSSQIVAKRVGFEVLIERKYSELLDDEGRVAFPGVTDEFIKVMGKRLY